MSDGPSTITKDDVVAMARLARLALNESEVTTMAAELNTIVQSMAALSTVDTSDVEPTAHAMSVAQRLRPDVVTSSLSPDKALAQAPKKSGTAFVVPKVVG